MSGLREEVLGPRWPKFDELISEPEDYLGESKVSGRDVPATRKAYLEAGGSLG